MTKGSESARNGKAKAPVVRRRRPREETRELLLQEAEDILVARLIEGSDTLNPLAALRITDVLASINARHIEGESRMTTGAVYQIWDSQVAFQSELLDRIMRRVSVPWEDRARVALRDAMDAGLPLVEVIASLSGGGDVAPQRARVELSLAAGLSAFVAPKKIRRAEKKANAEYVRVLGGMLEEILAYTNRKVLDGLAVEDIIWSIEALAVGLNLRERTHPELVNRSDDQGIPTWQHAVTGIVLSMSEPLPGRRRQRPRRAKA